MNGTKRDNKGEIRRTWAPHKFLPAYAYQNRNAIPAFLPVDPAICHLLGCQYKLKPTVKIATARTPDGSEMALYQHDRDFSIRVNSQDLMHSRQNESELELARLGCAHLTGRNAPCILIGGLGMGYTLRQALDMIGPHAKVVVGELLGAVVEWNIDFLGELNGQPLRDKRVDLKTGDVVELISRSKSRFDAILLDIDNGPSAMTDSGNHRLYGHDGIKACRRALRAEGCLAIWSAAPSTKFEKLLISCSFHVRRFRVPAYKGSKSQSRFVWIASEDKVSLPPGGKSRLPLKNKSKGSSSLPRKRLQHSPVKLDRDKLTS